MNIYENNIFGYNGQIVPPIWSNNATLKDMQLYEKTGLDLRQTQVLLGHGSSKMTEIYTYEEANTFKTIKIPLD